MELPSNNIEILAPVGGHDQLIAAVRAGADAVYLGAGSFNARRNAENFGEPGALRDAVRYCRARGVKVHVTMNTLVTDSELPAAEAAVRAIADAGADAVIVQDLAVAELVRRFCPDIELHASTQMAVHNAAGVRALAPLGFTRAVLARELTLDEIRAITASTDMETEVFVHGALCMSASGLCELSAMIGGRSGNRGLCAQPCRLDFNCRGRGYALSLRDMSHIGSASALADAGVRSLKIEGRMKRPEYVAAAVTACRQALRGEAYDEETLRAVFSRSGFTDGYLTGRRTLDMFGHRTDDDAAAGQSVLGSLAALYRAERRSVPVGMSLTLAAGKPAALTVSDGGHTVSAVGAVPEPVRTVAMTFEAAEKNLSKTGGTPFYLDSLTAELADGLTVPASELNRLRREATDGLLRLREEPAPKPFTPFARPALPEHAAAVPALRLRFEKSEQVFDCPEAELVILPVAEIRRHPELITRFGERLAGEIPALVYPAAEESLRGALTLLKASGLRGVLCENIGALSLAAELSLAAYGGASLNILNSDALERYARMGLEDATMSVETSMQELRRMPGGTRRGVLAYGFLPLMKLRCCPAQGPDGCRGCTGATPMTDRKGESFTVVCREKQYSELLNCVPLYIGDRPAAGADFCTLYFTVEPPERCAEITALFLRGGSADFRRTGGLYYRQVL